MGDEETLAPQSARSRSRSPHVLPSQSIAETDGASKGWAATFRQALNRKLGLGSEEEPDIDTKDAENVGDVSGKEDVSEIVADEANADEMMVEDVAYEFACMGCGKGFHEIAQLNDHWRASISCCAESFQAAVDHMACLPGARTTLWCPACPDECVGKWTGSANKVAALLRHLMAAGSENSSQVAPHRRLQAMLIELLLAEPPEGSGSLQEWAAGCKLLAAVGPLLACPGVPARQAIEKLQDEMLGKEENVVPDLRGVDDDEKEREQIQPDPNADKTKLRILGLDLTVDDTSGSALYEDLPEDTGGIAEVAEDGFGCSLPDGGVKALTTFDLTLSSDEEAPLAGNTSTREEDAEDTFV